MKLCFAVTLLPLSSSFYSPNPNLLALSSLASSNQGYNYRENTGYNYQEPARPIGSSFGNLNPNNNPQPARQIPNKPQPVGTFGQVNPNTFPQPPPLRQTYVNRPPQPNSQPFSQPYSDPYSRNPPPFPPPPPPPPPQAFNQDPLPPPPPSYQRIKNQATSQTATSTQQTQRTQENSQQTKTAPSQSENLQKETFLQPNDDREGNPKSPLEGNELKKNIPLFQQIQQRAMPVTIQGSSLKTMSFSSPYTERIHVGLKTNGRPLDATVELWQGPNNTPVHMRVYSEDGRDRPFTCVLETPYSPSTVAIRNINVLEFPIEACVAANAFEENAGAQLAFNERYSEYSPSIIQGGALRSYPFDVPVDSIQVLLQTDGRPLSARIELIQGPNNNKQIVELYADNGLERPFYFVMETPYDGNVVRIVNTASMEFPLTAWVEPYRIRERQFVDWTKNEVGGSYLDPVIGGY